MTKRGGTVQRLATPLRAWAQRFAFFLLVSGAFGLMLLGRTDGVLLEHARSRLTDGVAPILDLVARPVSSVNRVAGNLRELAELRQINEQLRAENGRLLTWHQRALRLENENAALRHLLSLAPEPGRRFVTARVVADQGGAFVRSVVIAAGKGDGVAKGQAVLSGEGLAGRIAEAGQRASRVLLITDINSRIPVLVGNARDRAVLAGDNTSQPKLDYLAPGTSVVPGDRVVTSGHGGVFPPGIPVGVVTSTADGAIRVRSYVDWAHLEYVRSVDYELPGLLANLDAEDGGVSGTASTSGRESGDQAEGR